jgi:acyl-[acyl-carrier-protein]-phospholipid O-acyltransferase/long-chain-fatty-acid--[acyl-carrier-protein] ligase
MSAIEINLLRARRFLPLFIAQFVGALTDNVFRSALVILVTYRLADSAEDAQRMATGAAGIFILPFFLFSATAGRLADRYDKALLIRLVKVSEIVLVALAAWAFLHASVPLLFVVLFLMGLHSTFLGPLKYAILPQHLRHDELIAGNALIEAGTFLAILIGMIVGGSVVLRDDGIVLVLGTLAVFAVVGLASSLAIPPAPSAAANLPVGFNVVAATVEMLRYAASRRDLFLSILGISWFWLVGATFLSQVPAFVKDGIGGDPQVVTLLLTVFSIGIGLGSLLCNRLLKGEVSAKHVPFGALGISLFAFDLWIATSHVVSAATTLSVLDFIAAPANWRILADLLLIAVCGGLFIVPLYAILQERSEKSHRARVIAANNIVNALFMAVGAGAVVALLAAGLSIPQVFLTVAAINLAVAVYICGLLPDELVKAVLAWVLRLAYRVEVHGIENYRDAGPRALVVPNHTSFLDAAILGTFLPGRPMFAVNTFIAQRAWVRPFLRLVNAFPVDPTNPLAMKALVRAVEAGNKCVIFPEGRITVTGALMKIYEGPGMVADRAGAPLIPVRIDGAQYTPFSRLKGKVRLRLFPKIVVTVLPPRRIDVAPELKGRARRRAIGRKLYDVMTEVMFETSVRRETLFDALCDARAIHGAAAPILEDIERRPLTYRGLITGSFALASALRRHSSEGERVGVLLPNATAAAATFFALQAEGRVPAMLNFSTGAHAVQAACRAAELRTVISSRRFIEVARLQDLVAALESLVRFVYLEDVRRDLSPVDRARGLLASLNPRAAHRRRTQATPDSAAVVLFTSGSEGLPKGVVLSHANLLSNCRQLAAVVDFNPSDIVFNALPLFHSFGLTGGLLLPALSGVRTFLYPSPLHYRIVPEMVYETNATIMFGTDTFLSGYAKAANAYDFYSVRYIFAGAERVKDETRRVWSEKFGLRILEGYGATETSPVIATNTPMHFKAGTVGRFLPGLKHRLEPMPGVERGGRLFVSGPNVMLGYLRSESPGVIERPRDGWYDTGDIVEVDEDGYVRIVGRAKRFAKVAGEMVPLNAVEELVGTLWPGVGHAVVALPDPRRGETLVLVTERENARRADLVAHAQARGVPEIFVPRTILYAKKLPVLGTGKTDYPAVKALVEQKAAAPATVGAGDSDMPTESPSTS